MRSPLERADGSQRVSIQTATLACVLATIVVLIALVLTGTYDAVPVCDDILGCG